jgi:hypothetical protein
VRLRIVVLTVVAAAALALFIAALLSIPQVASLFQERALLEHDYDTGETGRFGRHILGAIMMLDHPLGIGPLQFAKYFPEDPHNSFLDAFVVGGWIGGTAFFALVLVSLAAGFRYLFVRTPFQAGYIAVYATYVVEVVVSYIIDVHHWRHYFLTLGVLWGLIVATNAACRRAPASSSAHAEAAPSPTR